MRRVLVLLVSLVASLCGCTENDPAPLYVDMSYQVRCLDCEPRANDDPAREVRAVDGEKGLTINCSAIEREGDRLVTFSLEHYDSDIEDVDYSLEVNQADIDSSDPGSGCRVRVTEGNNTYEGLCTSGSPNSDDTCQLKLDQKGDGVTGSLLCLAIPNKAQPTITRNVVAPGTEKRADLEVRGCGL